MNPATFEITTASEEETRSIGAAIASWLKSGDVVLLHGDLGAGKTTLAKGIANGLGVADVVSSPSFALVNEYEVRNGAMTKLYHLDLFRLDNEDLDDIGFDDLVRAADAVILVEWPERAGDRLRDRYLLVEFANAGEQHRRLRFSAHPGDPAWEPRMGYLRRHLPGSS